MTLFEIAILQRIIEESRRLARREPKKRARHLRSATRAKRLLRKDARRVADYWAISSRERFALTPRAA
jgi:hypothetical protein